MVSPEAVPAEVGATEIGGAELWNEPQTVALGFSACEWWSESVIMYDVIPMIDRGQWLDFCIASQRTSQCLVWLAKKPTSSTAGRINVQGQKVSCPVSPSMHFTINHSVIQPP